jgi:hypothetical protein
VPFAHACNPTGLLQYYYYSNPQEAEVRKIEVQSQPRKIVLKTYFKKKNHKQRTGRVAQGEGPEYKPPDLKIGLYI